MEKKIHQICISLNILKKNIILQQDGFLDKALKNISELEHSERPIN